MSTAKVAPGDRSGWTTSDHNALSDAVVELQGLVNNGGALAAPLTIAPTATNIGLTLKPPSTTPPQDFFNITSSTGVKMLRILYDLQETDPNGPAVVMTMEGGNGGWTMGIDATSAVLPGRDFAIAKRGGVAGNVPGAYFDCFYIEHNGTSPPSIQINNSSAFAPQGSLEIMMATDGSGNVLDLTASNLVIHTGLITGGTPQTQPALRMRNWTSGTDRFHLEPDGSINIYDAGGGNTVNIGSVSNKASFAATSLNVGATAFGTSSHSFFIHNGAANSDIAVQTTSGGAFQVQALNASATVNLWTTNNADLIIGTNGAARLTVAKTTGGLTHAFSQTLAAGASDITLETKTPVIAGAFTATRLNYILASQPTGAATITDAAVFQFDAAAGTHKATVGPTTKTTPTAVTAWLKYNMNGTILFGPLYASTTA